MARLRIEVRSSPETNDHQVCLFADEQNVFDRLAKKAIGLDPDDLLTEPCRLLPGDPAEACLIGRCECGVVGCDDVRIRIAEAGQVVIWSGLDRRFGTLQFEAAAYRLEVARALADHGWETPDRTAARRISETVDRAILAAQGLRFSWASGRVASSTFTVSLQLDPGPYQVLVHLAWDGSGAPQPLAERVVALLATPARSWVDVQWSPLQSELGPPALAGADWRPLLPA